MLQRYRAAADSFASDYDAPEHEDGLYASNSAAQTSAILSPFRHLLAPPVVEETRHDDDFLPTQDEDDSHLPPGAYSAGRASPMLFGGGSSERGSLDMLSRRRSLGPSVLALDEQEEDPEAEERLANEWGLGEIMSQLGSGSLPTSPVGGAMPLLPFPKGMVDDDDQVEALETRSMPDLDRPRALSTASLLDPSAASPSAQGSDPPLRRIRILERRGSDARLRTQSLGDGLQLPSFGDLPSFADMHPDTARRPSMDPLISPNTNARLSTFSTSPEEHRRSLFSLGDHTSAAEPNSRVSSTFTRPHTAMSSYSRPLSRLSIAPSTSLDPPSRGGGPVDDPDDSRPLSSLSIRPSTPATFTSRFDPAAIAAARAEIEKERPVFANKQAGAPPAIVLMPAPLANRPPSPPRKMRKEGPESDHEDEVETLAEGDEEAGLPQRPAGALYGRSLMDVMAERQNLLRGRAKHYVSGQDGRRSMMDWGDSPAAQKVLGAQGEELAADEGNPNRRSKGVMSVFGEDVFYKRDMERLKLIQAEEAKEREAEEEKERIVRELEAAKQEKKRSGKGKLLKASRPSGEFPRGEHIDAGLSPPTSPTRGANVSQSRGAGHTAMAPSISLPVGLANPPDGDLSSSWFPVEPPPKPPSSASSDSNGDHYEPPPVPERTPLAGTSFAHATDLPALSAGALPQLQLDLGLGEDEWSKTEELQQDDEIRVVSAEGRAGLEEDDEDDMPLAVRASMLPGFRGALPLPHSHYHQAGGAQPFDEEDDVPLGVRASMLPPFQRPDEDDDDRPLGLAAMGNHGGNSGYVQQQQQHHFYLQQQQSQAALYQQQAAFAMAMQQHNQFGYGFAGSDMGSVSGGGGMVDKWRRGVEG